MSQSDSYEDTARRVPNKLILHLAEVQRLLSRHRLVENMVHRQDMPRHDLVENLVQKQHLSEINHLLSRLSLDDVAKILEALPSEDRVLIWGQIHEARGEEILERISDDLREELVSIRHQQPSKAMLNAFELQNGKLRQVQVTDRGDLANLHPIWVDLVAPSVETRKWVGDFFGLDLPNPSELTDLEASARFYVEDNGEIHLVSDFLLDMENESRNVAVALILHRDILFSVRQEELPIFRLQRLRARTQPGYVSDGKDVLLSLYSADAEYSADALEDVYAALEEVSKQVLNSNMTDAGAAKILSDIAREEDVNGRIRRNVLDTRRAVSFLLRGKLLSFDQQEDARQIMRDIESLHGHTSFLFGKINFLMDATVGFININQNKIVKIFSVASVALLPPTLIASIYGMNFQGVFPEIHWKYGYPFSLTLMLVSVVVPFWYFRKKGWLR
jgi:magnesium transporter